LVDDDTYLLLTGIVESQVDLSGISASSEPKIKYPRAMLPMKFIDTIKQGAYDDSALLETDPDFALRVESDQTRSMDGEALIKDVRSNLSESENLMTRSRR